MNSIESGSDETRCSSTKSEKDMSAYIIIELAPGFICFSAGFLVIVLLFLLQA